eukprot:12907578-Prorocentrum_lima.AAC.1
MVAHASPTGVLSIERAIGVPRRGACRRWMNLQPCKGLTLASWIGLGQACRRFSSGRASGVSVPEYCQR